MAVFKLTRRDLLGLGLAGVAGAGGLAVGFWYGKRKERWAKTIPPRPQPFSPSVYLAIDLSGAITVFVHKTEMGQGVHTSLPMIVAEELDADFSLVRVEQAPASKSFGDQLTGVSTSVTKNWDELRAVGAAARSMLIAAAASIWDVEPSSCRAEKSFVIHTPTGRRLSYGALAPAAAKQKAPSTPALKKLDQFTLVGTSPARTDLPAKVNGSAVFGIDVRLPGMVYAVVARAPSFGASLENAETTRAEAFAGVVRTVRIASGVAVVAEETWTAIEARKLLNLTWSAGPHAALDTAAAWRLLEEAAARDGTVVRNEGDVSAAAGAKKITAEYRLPYLAHANMEPINCTVWLHGGRAEVWAPTQHPQGAQAAAAQTLGIAESNVTVHVTFAGTGFGRKVEQDAVAEACAVAKEVGRPVSLIFTREDELKYDRYRPIALHKLTAAVDAEGWPVSWHHKIISPSILAFAGVKGPFDPTSVEGADIPYAIPNVRVEHVSPALPVPLGFWRSVGHSHNAFAVESFVDELAANAGKDPIEYRRKLVEKSPRHLAVLNKVAERARWFTAPPGGRFHGVALHASFGSWVAQIAEISLENGRPKLHRVSCAVDCGIAVHPGIIVQQMEGGITFGLTAALHGEIQLQKGAITATNFHEYPLLRNSEMPAVDVDIIHSGEPPSGIGEVGVPPIAPALANAIFKATGQRVRQLPFKT